MFINLIHKNFVNMKLIQLYINHKHTFYLILQRHYENQVLEYHFLFNIVTIYLIKYDKHILN